MCDPVSITLGITAAAGAYGAYSADKARDEAKDAAKRQQETNDKQMAELNKPKPQMVDPSTAEADIAAKRRKEQLRAGLFSTIKTSPLGTTAATGKTKLGQ